jgi:hypothetical protein
VAIIRFACVLCLCWRITSEGVWYCLVDKKSKVWSKDQDLKSFNPCDHVPLNQLILSTMFVKQFI